MPSPIAHSATGIALGQLFPERAPSSRWRRLVRLASLLVLANVADLDFIFQLVFDRRIHHTFSHSLVFTLTIAGLVGLIFAVLGRDGSRAFLLTAVLYGSHVLLDMLGGGPGVQLLWPFSAAYVIAPIQIFPPVHYSRGVLDASHLTFIAFESVYSALLLIVFRSPLFQQAKPNPAAQHGGPPKSA
jgi:inner membrane protein